MIKLMLVCRRWRAHLSRYRCALIACLCCGFSQASAESVDSDPHSSPKLVVILSIDQLRRDRLGEATSGGLNRLVNRGRIFVEAQLAHAISTTCPGHASILTGLNPSRHGLPSNTFVDRETGQVRYCVADDDPAHQTFGGQGGRSPLQMRASTLGDWSKQKNPDDRVFALAGKDRSAITMGGKHADGAYWFDRSQGRFTTSGYYHEKMPEFLDRFNGVDPLQGGLLSDLPEYWEHGNASSREDDFEGEDRRFKRVSGHPLKKGDLETVAKQIYSSPFLDKATIALARVLVEEKSLGQGAGTDYLAIGLSATDTLGHLYGPRSAEALDALRRLDLWLGELFVYLDERLGQSGYVVVLTADHGVAELPEWRLADQRMTCPEKSGRVEPESFFFGFYWHLYKSFSFPFGDPRELVQLDGGHIFVREDGLRAQGLDRRSVVLELQNYLQGLPEIERAWSIGEIERATDGAGLLLKRSLVADRAADILVELAEGCLISGLGTTHGSHHDYDRDIPIIFYGPRIEPGRVAGPAFSIDIAPTLGNYLGIKPDVDLDGMILPLRSVDGSH